MGFKVSNANLSLRTITFWIRINNIFSTKSVWYKQLIKFIIIVL